MTTHLDHVKTAVLALTRHQIRSLVKAAQGLDQAAMDVLEQSWDAVAGLEPELTKAAEALCDQGQEEDLLRFQQFGKDEDRDMKQFVLGPDTQVSRLMTGVGLLLVVVFGLGALVQLTPVSQLLLAVAVSAALIICAGVITARKAEKHLDHVFQNPAMSAEHVWVAATDAALALALEHRHGAENRHHLEKLTGIWTAAGLPLDILRTPRYRLAA